MTTTVNLVCRGTDKRVHNKRTAAQYYDKYLESWSLTPSFGPELYGSERKILQVPGAHPGDDLRMWVVIDCPNPECGVRPQLRWENLYTKLDEARERGWAEIPINSVDTYRVIDKLTTE